MKLTREAEFEDYVRRRRGVLLRSATALAAGDGHLAEDLVQQTLVRLYLVWEGARARNLDAYVRRMLVNNLIDHKRRSFIRREHAVRDLPDTAGPTPADSIDSDLLSALRVLPPRQRAVIVLRCVEGLTIEEAAEALNCSSGTVKSQTSRGLDKLRHLLASTTEPQSLTAPDPSPARPKATQR
jgi:RNA polymerase sigma-70 factor (sigma-E family)